MGDDLFFDPNNEPRRAQLQRLSLAETICQDWPVVIACRDYALQQGEPYGVWVRSPSMNVRYCSAFGTCATPASTVSDI